MTEAPETPASTTRRIRPWIAGLLTLLGWGVGLFYAGRTRAALYMIAANLLIGVVLGGAAITYLYLNGPTQFSIVDPNGVSIIDIVTLTISVALAIGVGVFVSRHQRIVEKAGPGRLFGYLGIWLLPIIGAIAIAFLIRSTFMQPFHIPAGSMKPALQVGDYLVVSKGSYGYSPASVAPFDGLLPKGRFLEHPPQRGDVVVFKNRKDGNKDYVKRLIGLPGDTVQMIGGRLHINGAAVQKDLISAFSPDICGPNAAANTYRETLDNGVSYIVQECSADHGPLDNTAAYQVPAGHYFMLGDNRDQSQDSRVISQVGYVAFDSLVGKVHLKAQPSE